MTQAPYPPPPPRPYAPPPPETNGLGIAGFIVSLVGIVLCGGALCPIGAVMSLASVFKPPRGFALAGLIIGVVGTVLWGIAWAMILYAMPNLMSQSELQRAEQDIDNYYYAHQTLPDDAAGTLLVDFYTDDWGTSLSYRRVNTQQYEIISAGLDQKFGTSDDIVNAFVAPNYFGGPGSMGGVGGVALPTVDAFAAAHKQVEDTFENDYDSPTWGDAQQALGDRFLDDWGTPIRYDSGAGRAYALRSAGPDLNYGTDDDIVRRYTLGGGEAENDTDDPPEGNSTDTDTDTDAGTEADADPADAPEVGDGVVDESGE